MEGTMALFLVGWFVDPDHGPKASLPFVWPVPQPSVYYCMQGLLETGQNARVYLQS